MNRYIMTASFISQQYHIIDNGKKWKDMVQRLNQPLRSPADSFRSSHGSPHQAAALAISSTSLALISPLNTSPLPPPTTYTRNNTHSQWVSPTSSQRLACTSLIHGCQPVHTSSGTSALQHPPHSLPATPYLYLTSRERNAHYMMSKHWSVFL
jgi:hypothetical protein